MIPTGYCSHDAVSPWFRDDKPPERLDTARRLQSGVFLISERNESRHFEGTADGGRVSLPFEPGCAQVADRHASRAKIIVARAKTGRCSHGAVSPSRL